MIYYCLNLCFIGNYPPAPAPGYVTPNAPGYGPTGPTQTNAGPGQYPPPGQYPVPVQYPPGPGQYPPGPGQYPPGSGQYPPGPGQYPPGPGQYPPGPGPIINQPTGPGGPQAGIYLYCCS